MGEAWLSWDADEGSDWEEVVWRSSSRYLLDKMVVVNDYFGEFSERGDGGRPDRAAANA